MRISGSRSMCATHAQGKSTPPLASRGVRAVQSLTCQRLTCCTSCGCVARSGCGLNGPLQQLQARWNRLVWCWMARLGSGAQRSTCITRILSGRFG